MEKLSNKTMVLLGRAKKYWLIFDRSTISARPVLTIIDIVLSDHRNNTPQFVAADFDGGNWSGDVRKRIQACKAAIPL